MWKVLIADDEPKIRRGLRSLLARFAEDFDVVGEAEDGEVALDMALELRPDVLLIDIRMPFKSGLTLIEELSNLLPNRLVIIVSGHDEFEYAQAAVKLKVFDYLLKPVSADTFAQIMEKAKSELQSRAESGKYAAWAKEQLARNIPTLREQFFKDWVTSSLSRSEAVESLAFLEIELAPDITLLGARFVESATTQASPTQRRLELVVLRNVLLDLQPSAGAYVFEDEVETLLRISPRLDEQALASMRERVRQEAARQGLRPLTIVARELRDPLSSLGEAYEELCAELSDSEHCEAYVVLARGYIDQHYWRPSLSLEEVAESLRLSPGYLSRLLKREMGCSFVEYLTRTRIKQAMHLMNDPGAKVFEVAEQVGYRSQHYFSRAFRKAVGFSPSDYRRGGAA